MIKLIHMVLMVSVIGCLAILSGCDKPVEGTVTESSPPTDAPLFVVPVQAVTPKRGDVSAFFETTSRIEARNRVEILSKGAGLCLKVNAEVGDTVTAGQALVELERDEFEAQIRQARVAVQQQKTAYEIAQRSFEEGIGASVERDNMKFAHEQALTTLEMAELKLRNQTVSAPISGIITYRIVQEGMVVSPGMPLFSLVDPASYTLPVNVPEKDLVRIKIGQEAQAHIDAFPNRVFRTRVSRINPSIDPLTGTVVVLLDFADEDKALLRDAAFARVKLVMEVHQNAVLVPRDAIIEEEGRKYVFLLDLVPEDEIDPSRFTGLNERSAYQARRVEIKTGLEQSDVIEVVQGIDDDMLVVTMGQHTLKPETYVMITNLDEEMSFRTPMTPQEALVAAEKNKDMMVSTESSSDASDLGMGL
ncbi:MAG: efflux RND transporter periplasmic adaptor subunit [Candidatus Hydrogenedentales bacterium]|jgi:membrane fusion protein (multidrug efflux system)